MQARVTLSKIGKSFRWVTTFLILDIIRAQKQCVHHHSPVSSLNHERATIACDTDG